MLEFDLGGQTHRRNALEAGPDTPFLVFSDRTSGRETHGGGRFLVTGRIQPDDAVEVDSNLAYNDMPIEAGEKVWTAPGDST